MSDTVRIRPFAASDHDYAAVAQLAAAVPASQLGDFEYAQPETLRAFDQSFAQSGHTLQRFVAEEGGALAGYAQLFQIPWMSDPGHFWLSVRVAPAFERRGVGTQLYGQLQQRLGQLGATRAWIMAYEGAAESCARLGRYGFHELLRSWPFVLDVRQCDLAPFQTALDRIAANGISITTLAAERARDPDSLRRLYELHASITRDIPLPGHAHPAPGLDWFEPYAFSGPQALPEAFFIARQGQRYVGESFVHRVEGAPEQLAHKATGIDSAYRGYGIAVALKVATIAYAQQHGYAQIWTGVESNNPSMLAINARFGFVQAPGLIVFEQVLSPM